MADQPPTDNMTLEECVKSFLRLVMQHPEKPPRRVRDQQANEHMIVGFNRAQETLRHILEVHGAASDIKALANVREEGQQRPERIGDRNVWVVG